MKLEVKHLSMYFPYGLKCRTDIGDLYLTSLIDNINYKAWFNYSYNNNYWYNKSRGLAQAIGKKYYYPSNNTLKTYASTLTLTKFN